MSYESLALIPVVIYLIALARCLPGSAEILQQLQGNECTRAESLLSYTESTCMEAVKDRVAV